MFIECVGVWVCVAGGWGGRRDSGINGCLSRAPDGDRAHSLPVHRTPLHPEELPAGVLSVVFGAVPCSFPKGLYRGGRNLWGGKSLGE